MISNPKYKGYYCGKKTEIVDYMTKEKIKIPKNNWIMYKDNINIPPIISEELWNKANAKLSIKKYKTNHKNIYDLSNKIYCKNDGCIFHRRKQVKASDDSTWLCKKYLKEGKKHCDSPNIRESEIIKILSNIFIELDINYNEIISKLIKMYPQKYTNNIIKILNKETIKSIMISSLIRKIIASKNYKNNRITLDIYLNTSYMFNYENKYEYSRGFNTTGTKRYKVLYHINIFLNKENV
jgi:hypothetical protein